MGLPKYEGMPGGLDVGPIRTLPSITWKRIYKRQWSKLSRRAGKNVVNLEEMQMLADGEV